MLTAKVKGQRFVLVTGIARSGTTLVASLLNSCENALVLQEPHNALLHYDRNKPPDENTYYGPAKVTDICTHLRTVGGRSRGMVGVKEVFEEMGPDNPNLLIDYALPEADIILIVLRDPLMTWASSKRTFPKDKFNLSMFMNRFHRFSTWAQHILECNPCARFITYEQVCNNPVRTLKMALQPEIMLEGLEAEKRPQKGFGDAIGLASTKICESVYLDDKDWEFHERDSIEAAKRMYWLWQ